MIRDESSDSTDYHVSLYSTPGGMTTLVSYGHNREGAIAHAMAWPDCAVAYATRRIVTVLHKSNEQK